MNQEIVKLEAESFSLAASETSASSLPLDQNPAAVYLSTLRPKGRRAMLHGLNVIAGLLREKSEALNFPWHQLRYQHTTAVVAALVEKGYRPASINMMLSGLRGVLNAAETLELMSAEDCRRACKVKNVRNDTLPKGRALATGEMNALLGACSQDQSRAGLRDAALVAVLYSGGLRRSEVVALDLSDFNQETAALTVRGGKGGKDRLVYLSGSEGSGAEAAVKDWLLVRGDKAGPLFCPVNKGDNLMFRRMTDQAVLGILKKRGREAHVQAFSPHDLRRTFISDLLDAGADIATVQKLAGHSQVTTTARYDRRGEATKKKAAGLLHVPYRKRDLPL
jgi:site-specific recombinase XerD